MVAGGRKAWSASSTRKARLFLGPTALPGSVLDASKKSRARRSEATMKFGKMMRVPVVFVGFWLLANPIRAEDEDKKKPPDPPKAADANAAAQKHARNTPDKFDRDWKAADRPRTSKDEM